MQSRSHTASTTHGTATSNPTPRDTASRAPEPATSHGPSQASDAAPCGHTRALTASDDAAPRNRARALTALGWVIATLVSAFIAFCTAVGPIYRGNGSIVDFGAAHAARFAVAFALCIGVIVMLTRWKPGAHEVLRLRSLRELRSGRQILRADALRSGRQSDARSKQHENARSGRQDDASAARPSTTRGRTLGARIGAIGARIGAARARVSVAGTKVGMIVMRGTDRWWKLALIMLVCWAWVPLALGSAYGYDVTAQIHEFSNWWLWLTGSPDAPDYHAPNTQMDVYPIGHYLWPDSPTWLTNQHNIVLTLLYGGVAHWLGAGRGLLALSATQFLFAVAVTAATADRVLQPDRAMGERQPGRAMGERQPGRAMDGRPDMRTAGMGRAGKTCDGTNHPESRDVKATKARTVALPARISAWWNAMPAGAATRAADPVTTSCAPAKPIAPAGPVARVAALAFLTVNPLTWSATISLTKSPLFAFGFLWSFGLWYQLVRAGALPRHGRFALAVATITMLISAKYGVIIAVVQLLLGLIVLRRNRRLLVLAMLVPIVAFQGALAAATSSGAIIGGDPIEGKAVQVQQIARIVQRDRDAIPAQARERLERIFDLDGMAEAYNPNDADPVKSSGGSNKHHSYRWRDVTADDMAGFNQAWLATCAASPAVCWDAFAAEWYGYFDVTDPPYVAQTYYVGWPNGGSVPGVAAYHHDWRARVVDTVTRWSQVPVLGWLTHANLWTVLTLLLMCAQAVRRHWATILVEVPLLMQMAVAAAAPANNFERHMLGVALAFAFVAVAYARDAGGDARDACTR